MLSRTQSQFTGKERDTETGLDYFGARYNASNMGRFMSPDPHNAGALLSQPQSWNAYAYVLNSPLVFVDPLGLMHKEHDEKNDVDVWEGDRDGEQNENGDIWNSKNGTWETAEERKNRQAAEQKNEKNNPKNNNGNEPWDVRLDNLLAGTRVAGELRYYGWVADRWIDNHENLVMGFACAVAGPQMNGVRDDVAQLNAHPGRPNGDTQGYSTNGLAPSAVFIPNSNAATGSSPSVSPVGVSNTNAAATLIDQFNGFGQCLAAERR